jgi:hypothetical protein
MATEKEAKVVYAAGLVQGIVLVTFPAASTIFTDPGQYDLSNTQYGTMFLPQVAIRRPEAQVPADRDDDHLGWEAEAGEGRAWNRSRARLASSHASSLAELAWSQRIQQRRRPDVARCGCTGHELGRARAARAERLAAGHLTLQGRSSSQAGDGRSPE